MYRQMTLWPELQLAPRETEIWQKFHPEAQRVLITTLARLIAKALCPDSLADPREVNHESK
ncbi:hypothetical protein ACFL0Q_03170 [Thermodesulfobacteriota bacterium]